MLICLGNPNTDTLVINDGYAIDFIWPARVPIEERAEFRLKALQKCILERPDGCGLEDTFAKITYGAHLSNYRFARVSAGSFTDPNTGKLDEVVFVRKRTKYDDEHTSPLTDFEVNGFDTEEPLPSPSELAQHIDAYYSRTVPKRGVEVAISDKKIKTSGLTKLVLRGAGPNRVIVEATIHGHERVFQIKNNMFFDKQGGPLDAETGEHSGKFASYCLKALDYWMCHPKVETNEGTVEEGKPGPIKGGYWSYLRIRPEDGYKYRYQPEQWLLCADEKDKDLDEESTRLAPLDPAGQMRNSTYVREHPNDGPHLPPLKVHI